MSNDLATINYALPAGIQDFDFYDEVAKSTSYLKSIKLYTKGGAIDKGLIAPGRWGVYKSKDEIIDLGTSIDVLPLAYRPCAIDWTDKQNIVRLYNNLDPEFQKIRKGAEEKNQNFQCGLSILLFERNTGECYDWFCYSKSTKTAAHEMKPYFAMNEETAAAVSAKTGKIVEPHGCLPVTLKVKLMTGRFSYHAPDVRPCSAPFTNLPDQATIDAEVSRFLNPPKNGGQLMNEDEYDGRDR